MTLNASELVYVLDHRFACTPDGRVWTDSLYETSFWRRYLAVFDRVRVVARVRAVPAADARWKRVDGDRVMVEAMPYYVGPAGYVRQRRALVRAMTRVFDRRAVVLLRVPSQLATCAASILRTRRIPFGVEVVGDPAESFLPGSIRHPLRAFFRWWYTQQQWRQCRDAIACQYVSVQLAKNYPCRSQIRSVCTDADLPDEAFRTAAPVIGQNCASRLVTVGSLEQMYKGTDVLIDAVADCVRGGLDLSLTVVGDGRHRSELEARAKAAGLNGHAAFIGSIAAGDAVRAQLDSADVFVLPSRTEGMPRALLEAFARGLPCIASRVGAIPELLPEEDLVPPGDARALAAKLREILSDRERLGRMAERNLAEARKYREAALAPQRDRFYRALKCAYST
jgi:glycosyltransferase involved in cell wall biosynthesis